MIVTVCWVKFLFKTERKTAMLVMGMVTMDGPDAHRHLLYTVRHMCVQSVQAHVAASVALGGADDSRTAAMMMQSFARYCARSPSAGSSVPAACSPTAVFSDSCTRRSSFVFSRSLLIAARAIAACDGSTSTTASSTGRGARWRAR